MSKGIRFTDENGGAILVHGSGVVVMSRAA